MSKTIVFSTVCPVLLLCLGCGEAPVPGESDFIPLQPGYVLAGPVYTVTVPDSRTSAVLWDESSLLLVSTLSTGETVSSGDTILSGTGPYFSMELERLEMSLSIAQATGDSFAADSISELLSDSSSFTHVISRFAGGIEYYAAEGATLQPGDTIAVITGAPPDSLYTLSPDYTHIRWPLNLPGCTATASGLECRGAVPGPTATLSGTWSVEPQFIHEDGLRSFLISTSGDTLPITILGTTGAIKIIYSTVRLDSIPLKPW